MLRQRLAAEITVSGRLGVYVRPLFVLGSGAACGFSTIRKGGLQWKQGVVFCMTLYTSLLYNTTPIHCTPDPLHPPLQSIQVCLGRDLLLGGWNPSRMVYYEYKALAKKTSALREAMLLFVEPSRSVVNSNKIVPRRMCGHFLKPC